MSTAFTTTIEESQMSVEIDVSHEDLAEQASMAWAALCQANLEKPFLFHRGTFVRIEHNCDGAAVIREMTVDRMRYTLARTIRFAQPPTKQRPGGPALPPIPLVRDILATPDAPLPPLSRIVEAPVFTADGDLVITPGYNWASRIFYEPAPDLEIPAVPVNPSDVQVAMARELLFDLIADFPFVGEPETAHAIALFLQPFCRDLINGATPLHLIEKPIPGTGATLLVDVLTYPATGRQAAIMTEGRDEDEWRKRITAKIATGPTFLLIDNLRRRLDSAAVSAAITAHSWEDRKLGHSDMITFPVSCAWIATGNNPAVSSEIARRTVRIRLDPRMDRPWLREGFRHPDLFAYARTHRGALICAALTLIRHWLSQGKPLPPNLRRLGMFESWSEVIGGILHAADIPGFMGNLQEFYETSDTEGANWRAFIAAWWERHRTEEVTVSDVFDLAENLSLGDGTERSQKTRLGRFLGDRRDRQFSDIRLLKAGIIRGQQRWKLETA